MMKEIKMKESKNKSLKDVRGVVRKAFTSQQNVIGFGQVSSTTASGQLKAM